MPQPKRLYELTCDELPPFTPETLDLVRWSVGRLPRLNQRILTDTFYDELFVLAPTARALFDVDMDPQKDRLLAALLGAARHADDPDKLEGHLRSWGVDHQRYGVTPEMYVYVGQALVRTLARLLGGENTKVLSSWVAVYQWMAAVMISGADEVGRPRSRPRITGGRAGCRSARYPG